MFYVHRHIQIMLVYAIELKREKSWGQDSGAPLQSPKMYGLRLLTFTYGEDEMS